MANKADSSGLYHRSFEMEIRAWAFTSCTQHMSSTHEVP